MIKVELKTPKTVLHNLFVCDDLLHSLDISMDSPEYYIELVMRIHHYQ